MPCGYCIGCRKQKQRDWMIRMVHESECHEQNSFVTLTYDDENLPENQTLVLPHFQKFMKRLRRKYGARIRFFHAGEYGGERGDPPGRPHYHAIIFGKDFSEDRELHDRGNTGHPIYRSLELEKLWPYGYSTIGDVNSTTCNYTAKYVWKKVVGDRAKLHYTRPDPETGELCRIAPEYATMSRRPGLGFEWFQRYWRDVYPHDRVIIKGKEYAPPKYYDQLLEHKDPDMYAHVLEKREVDSQAENRVANATDQRLQDREKYHHALDTFFTRPKADI